MLVVIVAIVTGFVVAVVQSSFFEWAFHRYWLHRPWLPKDCFTAHTLIHHQLCKFDDTFHVHDEEQHEAIHFQWWGGPVLLLINGSPWIITSVVLALTHSTLPWQAFLISYFSVSLLYYIGYEGLHYLMHRPLVPWIQRMPYFRFIERHHRIHHVHMDRNLNVLVPIADFFLGTLVLETVTPAVTPANARRLARRHSKFGQKLREHDAHDEEEREVGSA